MPLIASHEEMILHQVTVDFFSSAALAWKLILQRKEGFKVSNQACFLDSSLSLFCTTQSKWRPGAEIRGSIIVGISLPKKASIYSHETGI